MKNLVVETITPQKAQQLLGGNIENRNVRKALVETYAADMAAGAWVMTGAPIILGEKNGDDGRKVWDGQHRLLACVKAGKPFTSVVLYDASSDIHYAIDRGAKRTIGDELTWRGERSVHALGATLNLLWGYDNGTIPSQRVWPSVRQLLVYLEEHPEVRDAVVVGERVRRKVPVNGAAFAATVALLEREHGDQMAHEFADGMVDGVELKSEDPLLALRNYAIRVMNNRMNRPRREEWMAICIKAANAWLAGRPLKNVSWRRVGARAEAFPRLLKNQDV